eukprot:338845-Chlamydomonas_euryale.AAC.1
MLPFPSHPPKRRAFSGCHVPSATSRLPRPECHVPDATSPTPRPGCNVPQVTPPWCAHTLLCRRTLQDRPVGAPYKALEPEDLNLRDTMRRMRAAGMGGTLYNRDDMLKYAVRAVRAAAGLAVWGAACGAQCGV